MKCMQDAFSMLDRIVEQPLSETILHILQKCRKGKKLGYAKSVHAHICNNGLEYHRIVGNFIVAPFVECGGVYAAQEAFSKLIYSNEHSWTSLMLGYLQSGQYQYAFNLYHRMQEDNIWPSFYTLTALLKASAVMKDLKKGREVHADIMERGFENDPFIGNTLVHMYSKCNSLMEAKEVFHKLPSRDTVSWNAIIAGHVENGLDLEALHYFKEMQLEGVLPDNITFICVLGACGNIKTIDKAREIHNLICPKGLETRLAEVLINIYAKCGSVEEARKVFDQLSVKSTSSWTTMISAYVDSGHGEKALEYYHLMQKHDINANSFTFLYGLKACAILGAIEKGREVHSDICQKGFTKDILLGNALIDMYVKCGSLTEAKEVFDKLPHRQVASWNALLTGYAKIGLGIKVLKCFQEMKSEGILPNTVTFVCSLKICSIIADVESGRQIHFELSQTECKSDLVIGNSLIDMYGKCGSLLEARKAFDNLSTRDIVSWTAMIAAYTENGFGEEALECFEQMEANGMSPDAILFVGGLKACASVGAIRKGQEIHSEIAREGLETDPFVGSSLVYMYVKCGLLVEAEKAFGNLLLRDIVSWNTIISGYVENGFGHEALRFLSLMQMEGTSPNASIFILCLKACVLVGDVNKGREIHMEIVEKGFDRDISVCNTLIDMYVKCSSLVEVQEAFDKLPVRDAISWTAIIAGYIANGLYLESLQCFRYMQLEGVLPNDVTFVCSLNACSAIGAIDKGREIHAELKGKTYEADPNVHSSLLDMYAKCGSLSEARKVFDQVSEKDVVSWNAMIRAYGINHEGKLAAECFELMQHEGIVPNSVTFICLLSACSRRSLIANGQEYFNIMRDQYRIRPTIDHYTCMIDLLARSGHLHGANKLLENVTLPLATEAWTALLNSCKIYGDAEVGLKCFQQLIQRDPKGAASYVLMADIYENAGRWQDAHRVEQLRVKEMSAGTLMETNKTAHEGLVSDSQNETRVDFLSLDLTLMPSPVVDICGLNSLSRCI